jgi:hypothetical protein
VTTLEELERRVAALEAEATERRHAIESGLAALGFGVNAGLASLREEMTDRFDQVDTRFDRVDVQLRRVEDWQATTDSSIAEILRRLPEPREGV